MISLFLLQRCNLSYVALHELASASARTLLKLASSVRALLKPYGDTLKLNLRVFLAGHSYAMVTYCVTKIIPTCSPVIGHYFDTMNAASIDKEWL